MFSKKHENPATTQATANPMTSGSTFSVLGADLAIKGNLTARADLHVDGCVDGDIACASLVQGESSTITGTVTADTARLAGAIRGAILAGSLVILKSARIEGDVTYDTLTIEQGARVDGRLTPRAASEPKLSVAGGTEA
jgi:cytoskeletal protein CcmA (bactofilin family)